MLSGTPELMRESVSYVDDEPDWAYAAMESIIGVADVAPVKLSPLDY